ncbi:hypothetical protein [Streptomyces sp. LN704]|uniref:hypothetical protein n=1 Tax=Streptomyces sp. LN704 TaxID=3112982 RepID=UPI00371C9813
MAVLDLTGALPYWKRDARALTELIQLRALALLGLHSAAAVGPNRMLAAMACNLTPPDRRTIIDHSPDAVAAFLRPRPVRELPGVGSCTRGWRSSPCSGRHTAAPRKPQASVVRAASSLPPWVRDQPARAGAHMMAAARVVPQMPA